MATVYQDSLAHGGFHPLQTLVARLTQFFQAWTAKRRHAREMRELAAFSDRELWDVGLSRSDMMAVDMGAFRRD